MKIYLKKMKSQYIKTFLAVKIYTAHQKPTWESGALLGQCIYQGILSSVTDWYYSDKDVIIPSDVNIGPFQAAIVGTETIPNKILMQKG